MDAKIAAAKVQSDLQNLSDEELIEVYSSLKGKDEYKVQFNKLMHQAGKRLKGILEKDEQEQTNNAGHAAAQNDEDLLNSNLTQVEQFETRSRRSGSGPGPGSRPAGAARQRAVAGHNHLRA